MSSLPFEANRGAKIVSFFWFARGLKNFFSYSWLMPSSFRFGSAKVGRIIGTSKPDENIYLGKIGNRYVGMVRLIS